MSFSAGAARRRLPTRTNAPAAEPRYSVVIPHYEQPLLLDRCLRSLEAQRHAPPFEIIVVDNGSSVLPTDVCARYSQVRLLVEPVKGPGPARNRGAIDSLAPVILFLDADCIADPDWIAQADRQVQDHPGCGIFGGEVRILPEDPARMSAIECYEELFAYRPEQMIRRHRFAVTCNMAVRRTLFEDVGPFIPGLLISEDLEWGRRAHARGYSIAFAPEMKIATPARSDFAEVARRWDRQVGQQHAEMLALPWGRLRWLLKTIAMPVSPLADLPTVLGSRRLSGWGARARAFQCLVQTRLWRTMRMIQLIVGAVDAAWLTGAWRRPPGTTPPAPKVVALRDGGAAMQKGRA